MSEDVQVIVTRVICCDIDQISPELLSRLTVIATNNSRLYFSSGFLLDIRSREPVETEGLIVVCMPCHCLVLRQHLNCYTLVQSDPLTLVCLGLSIELSEIGKSLYE